MNLAISDLINVVATIVGIAAILVPMHQANRNMIKRQGRMAKRAWKAIRSHEELCSRRWIHFERIGHKIANAHDTRTDGNTKS